MKTYIPTSAIIPIIGIYVMSIFIPHPGYSQGIRNLGAIGMQNVVITIATAGTGHYTALSSGILHPLGAVGSSSMVVNGNWVNNSTNTGFTQDGATVLMAGTTQTIGGTNSTTFYNLYLQNGSVKTLTNNIAVGGMSTLTGLLDIGSSELNLNQYTLTITNPNMTIARTTGYINSENGCGTCNVWSSAVTWSTGTTTGARIIPFGVSGTYIPFTFNKTNAVNTNITVSTRSAVANNSSIPSNVTHMNVPAMSVTQTNDGTNTVIDRWWYITPSTSSTSPVSLDLNFYYRGVENTATGCPQTGNFGAQYWANYSASNYGWYPCAGPSWTCSTMGTWPGVTAGTQNATTSTGPVNLPVGNLATSYWVLSCSNNPLPIELVEFTAVCQNNNVGLLKWKTASEVNALKFDIQSSDNGTDFITIGNINAQYPNGGQYSWIDNTEGKIHKYYRLKMIDKDYSFKYSHIIDLDYTKCNRIRTQIYAYGQDVMLNIQSVNNQKMNVEIYDALGRTLLEKSIMVEEGSNQFKFPLQVANGIYFVKLMDEKNQLIETQKVIISHPSGY